MATVEELTHAMRRVGAVAMYGETYSYEQVDAIKDVSELRSALIELERLRAWQAAALPIVERVAALGFFNSNECLIADDSAVCAPWLYVPAKHSSGCYVTRAQALLAQTTAQEGQW